MNRIRAGFCVYPNPRYPQKFYRVSLCTEDVLGIVFWTRNPEPMLPHLSELDKRGFTYYFQYTVLGYPRTIDLRSPSLNVSTKTFCELSQRIGPGKVIWRYDPVILNRELTMTWHQDNFRRIADAISMATHRVVISVIDPYLRTQKRLGGANNEVLYNPDAYTGLLHWLLTEAAARNLRVQSCAETVLKMAGIEHGRCVDASFLCNLRGRKEPARIQLQNNRKECLCHKSVDIGVNDSCGFGCQYCYATRNHERAMATLKRHGPEWTCITQDVQINAPVARTMAAPA